MRHTLLDQRYLDPRLLVSWFYPRGLVGFS